jgi:dolichol-phosphate mannosyltransferase
MDADLQDPPEMIPRMIDLWQKGYHLVYARRRKRHGESFFKRVMAGIFYRTLNLLSEFKIPMDTGDFRLMDRAVVNDFKRCREQNRFVRGLTAWMGYNQTAVEFDRPARYAGETKYNPLKLFFLSLDVITGFSIIPLRIVTGVGFVIALLSMAKTIHIVIQKLFLDLNIQGYALLASGLFFLGGVQIFFLGIMGEYIGRIYRQVQQRPLYLIKEDNIVE